MLPSGTDDRVDAHAFATHPAHGVLGFSGHGALGHARRNCIERRLDAGLCDFVGVAEDGDLGCALHRPQPRQDGVGFDECRVRRRTQGVPHLVRQELAACDSDNSGTASA